MNFAHLSLLGGLALVLIPVTLHLLGRQQPVLIDFPALRFVRQTRLEESANWRLRHVLLLLLRVLLVAAVVLALARPRVHSAMLGSTIAIAGLVVLAALAILAAAIAWSSRRPKVIWGVAASVSVLLWMIAAAWGFLTVTQGPALPTADSSAPVAMVIVIDTSPSMAYQSNNQTRLEAAREMATWLLDRVPPDSHVAVLSDIPVSSLAISPSIAHGLVERLQKTTGRVDLASRLHTAVNLVLADALDRKEIYVLTDMNQAAWSNSRPDLTELVGQHQNQVLIQIVDVGVAQPVNWQLGDPGIDTPSVPEGSDVTFHLPVSQLGVDGSQHAASVELWQYSQDPRLPLIDGGQMQLPASSVVDRQVVQLLQSTAAQVELSARQLSAGTHHFKIKLDKSDPLSIDNERFVSITAHKPQPTLIVCDQPDVAQMLRLIADSGKGAANNGAALVSLVSYLQLPQAELSRYQVFVMYDPPSLARPTVEALEQQAKSGKRLMLILGPALEPLAANLDNLPMAQLLPGKSPRVLSRPGTDRTGFWQPRATSHLIYQELQYPVSEIAWQLMPIFRSFDFQELHSNSQVLATVSNDNSALLIQHSIGKGQILTLTTPLPELESTSRVLWNEMWISDQFWVAFGILSGALRSLSGVDNIDLTFASGAAVQLGNDTTIWPSRWELFWPDSQRTSIQSLEGSLLVGQPTDPGNYFLRGTMGGPVSRGFSVNIPASDTKLTPVTADQLDAILGSGAYRIARDRQEVDSSVGQARFGRELYPLMMLFVAGLFLAEQVMSNRFYQIPLRMSKEGA